MGTSSLDVIAWSVNSRRPRRFLRRAAVLCFVAAAGCGPPPMNQVPPDQSVEADMAGAPDLASLDLSSPDLVRPPDLVPPPDFVIVDLSMPDFSLPPDLGHCGNGKMDDDETDVDCGGSMCLKCGTGKGCKGSADCVDRLCTNNRCDPPACNDGVLNGQESDVDCGGVMCAKCAVGRACRGGADCVSDTCTNNVCRPPPCMNAKQDGMETDIDCGGMMCLPCADGKLCAVGKDCTSLVCAMGKCQAPTCMDMTRNQGETDVDCGGPCPSCADGKACGAAKDCASKVCKMNVCQVPSCVDGVANGAESDVDCGGGMCGKCPNGKHCANAADCTGGNCNAGTCAPRLTFAMARLSPTIAAAASIALGDFDGDGKLDVVTTDPSNKNQVGLQAGSGDGLFGAPKSIAVGRAPRQIKSADLNGDKKPDVVFTGLNTGSLFSMLGDGNGGFGAPNSTADFSSYYAFAIGDMNNDGKPDVVAVGDGVNIYPGKGDGTFGQRVYHAPPDNAPQGVALADFNKDGKLDVATVANYGMVWLGNGDGTLQKAALVMGNPNFAVTLVDVVAGDFNADGNPDLAFSYWGNPNGLTVWLGKGDGTFNQGTFNPCFVNNGWRLVAADLTGDGKIDIAGGHALGNSGAVMLFTGVGDGSFKPALNYGAGQNSVGGVATGDVDGDGRLDLVVSNLLGTPNVSTLLGSGGPVLQAPATWIESQGEAAASIGVCDFDGDGNPDLAGANNVLTFGPGRGDGTFGVRWPANPFLSGGKGFLVTGDYNRDGKDDVALGTNLGFTVWLATGNGNFTQGGSGGFNSAITSGIRTDINGDGFLDLMAANMIGIGVLQGGGNGTFGQIPQIPYGAKGLAAAVAVGDLNGDGFADVITAINPGFIGVNLGKAPFNGVAQFQAVVYVSTGNLANTGIVTGDFNGDKKLDVAVTGSNGVGTLTGKGDGTFQPVVAAFANSTAFHPIAADFNADGWLDLAADGGPGKPWFEIFVGNNDGTLQAPVLFPTGFDPLGLALVDFNRDGKPDLAWASNAGNMPNGGNPGHLAVSLNYTK